MEGAWPRDGSRQLGCGVWVMRSVGAGTAIIWELSGPLLNVGRWEGAQHQRTTTLGPARENSCRECALRTTPASLYTVCLKPHMISVQVRPL